MTNLVAADLFALRRSRGLVACFVAAAACAVIFMWFGQRIAAGGLQNDAAGPGSLFSDVFAVHLLGSLVAGTLISRDFESKTVHDALLAQRRSRVVAARSVTYVIVVALLVLPYAVVALVSFVARWEVAEFLPTPLLGVAANTSGVAVDAAGVTTAVALGLAAVVGYAGQLAVVIPLSFILRRPAAIMGLGFAWGFAADSLAGLVPDGWGQGLLSLTPYGERYDLTLASSGSDILLAVLVSVVFIVVMAGLAYARFRTAEVK